MSTVAAVRKITLESVESRVEGDIDLRGVLGLVVRSAVYDGLTHGVPISVDVATS